MWVGGQRHAPAALSPGKDPAPVIQEAGWASRPVWTGAENLAPTGIRFPDRSARSELLYRLSCRGLRRVAQIAVWEFVLSAVEDGVSF
jgi:hypothetical protein